MKYRAKSRLYESWQTYVMRYLTAPAEAPCRRRKLYIHSFFVGETDTTSNCVQWGPVSAPENSVGLQMSGNIPTARFGHIY